MAEKQPANYQYNETQRRLVITNANGKKMTVANVSQAQATEFARKHAAEHARRDVSRSPADGFFTRDV